MYRVRILDAATRELERLDRLVGRRIVERINWLAANFETIRPEALTGDLAGFYKLRVGDYRVLYEIPVRVPPALPSPRPSPGGGGALGRGLRRPGRDGARERPAVQRPRA